MSMRATADGAVEALREPSGRVETEDQVVRLYRGAERAGEPGEEAPASLSHAREPDSSGRIVGAIARAITREQVYEAVVDKAAEALGAASAALFLHEEETPPPSPVHAYNHSDAEAKMSRTGRCRSVPLQMAGRTLGTLTFAFEGAIADEPSEHRLLELIARHGACALERLRLLEAEAHRRERAEAEASRVAVLNHATRLFSEASTRLPSLLETIAEQVAIAGNGSSAAVLFGDGDIPRASGVFPFSERILAVAEALSARTVPPDLDGDVNHVVPLTAGGAHVGLVCLLRDARQGPLSEAERAFVGEIVERAAHAVDRALLYEANRRARLRAELLYGLVRLVIGAESTAEVLEPSLDAIGRAVHAERAAVLLCDADGVMRFRAFRGLSEGYRAAVEGHSPWPRDERSPSPVVIGDAARAPSLAGLLPVIRAEGIRALAFIPLVTEGRILGKFMLYFDEPHELSPQELDLATAIANHVAAAVARLEAVAEMRHTVRVNEMFTGMLGHDLRNPLGAIMTAAQLATKRAHDERLHKPLGRIVNSGRRMARMIDQLLDFTRVRVGGGLPLSTETFDVVPEIRQVIEETSKAAGRSIALESVGDAVGDWDRERIGQVFSTLVGNAVQHGAPEMPARVRVDGTDPRAVRVEVTNGGVIPHDLVAKVFEPMTGGDGRRAKSQGLGLGLYITKQIVRAHGGDVDAQSSVAGETAFHVVLPRVAHRAPGHAR